LPVVVTERHFYIRRRKKRKRKKEENQEHEQEQEEQKEEKEELYLTARGRGSAVFQLSVHHECSSPGSVEFSSS